jgi:hypothetical protein
MFMKNKMDEARLYREDRICTRAFVNIIAPLVILALIVQINSRFMLIVPIQDQQTCFLSFLAHESKYVEFD